MKESEGWTVKEGQCRKDGEGWTVKKEKPRKAKDGRKGSESQMKGEGW